MAERQALRRDVVASDGRASRAGVSDFFFSLSTIALQERRRSRRSAASRPRPATAPGENEKLRIYVVRLESEVYS